MSGGCGWSEKGCKSYAFTFFECITRVVVPSGREFSCTGSACVVDRIGCSKRDALLSTLHLLFFRGIFPLPFPFPFPAGEHLQVAGLFGKVAFSLADKTRRVFL